MLEHVAHSFTDRPLSFAVYRCLNGPVPFGLRIAFFVSLAVFWSAFVGFVDYFVFSAIVQQGVAVDPAAPSQAALASGLQALIFFTAMAMLPVQLFVLWLWTLAARTAYRQIAKPPAGGAIIHRDGYASRVLLSRIRPFTRGLLHLGGMALIGTAVVMLAEGSDPSLSLVVLVWGVILCESLLMLAIRRMKFCAEKNG